LPAPRPSFRRNNNKLLSATCLADFLLPIKTNRSFSIKENKFSPPDPDPEKKILL